MAAMAAVTMVAPLAANAVDDTTTAVIDTVESSPVVGEPASMLDDGLAAVISGGNPEPSPQPDPVDPSPEPTPEPGVIPEPIDNGLDGEGQLAAIPVTVSGTVVFAGQTCSVDTGSLNYDVGTLNTGDDASSYFTDAQNISVSTCSGASVKATTQSKSDEQNNKVYVKDRGIDLLLADGSENGKELKAAFVTGSEKDIFAGAVDVDSIEGSNGTLSIDYQLELKANANDVAGDISVKGEQFVYIWIGNPRVASDSNRQQGGGTDPNADSDVAPEVPASAPEQEAAA